MFLIFPKYVDIARLNTDAQVTAGTTISSLRDLRTVNANDGVTPRDDGRRYNDPITLRAQIETGSNRSLMMGPFGAMPDSRMKLVFLMSELRCMGLIDATGNPLLKPRDMLLRIRDEMGNTIQEFEDPPGMFFVEVTPSGFGFGSGGANLLVVTLENNPAGQSA